MWFWECNGWRQWEGWKWIVLKEEPSLTRLEVSFKRLARAWEPQDHGFLVELRAIAAQTKALGEVEAILSSQRPREVDALITEYATVFQTPTTPTTRAGNWSPDPVEGGARTNQCKALSLPSYPENRNRATDQWDAGGWNHTAKY